MELQKKYIIDDEGRPISVIIDFSTFKKIEELITDFGLARAMDEVKDEEEIDLETAIKLSNFKE